MLGDSGADKFEFKADCIPAPDGLATRFFVGQTRVVTDSLKVYMGGEAVMPPSGVTIDPSAGTFDLATPPAANLSLQASFLYQWFTDDDLQAFIDLAAQSLGFEDLTDTNLVVRARPVVLDFACYYAYMRKAAEYANSVVAAGAGYSADQSKSGPNWQKLADGAWKIAKERLDLYLKNPLTGAGKPSLKFVTIELPQYVPPASGGQG